MSNLEGELNKPVPDTNHYEFMKFDFDGTPNCPKCGSKWTYWLNYFQFTYKCTRCSHSFED